MVPNNYFEDQKTIYCFVERCIDGDTIRCRHIPGYSWRLWSRKNLCQPLQTRGIADQTLSIRVYGVDCPEIAKNTRQTTQPFGDAAHEFTKSMVLHKVVRITFLRRDQYGRAVAAVETIPPFPFFLPTGRKDLSAQLAKHGLAELYMGGGAEYWVRRATIFVCVHSIS
jgi:endonuclease YncB( thermonuclease family)